MDERTRILVVEDDPGIAASLRRALAYDGHDVTTVVTGEDALDRLGREAFDLVVLDLMLPGIDGVEVCRRIRSAGDDVAVLMLTARDGLADKVGGLDAGADDYLVKPFAHEELLARVRSLLRRAKPRREKIAVGDLVIDVDAMEVRRGERAIELTATEFRLLCYLARNERIVLDRARILEAVWGLDVDTTSNIVDVYIRYLRQKIEADGEPPLIHTVRGVGYVMRS